MPDADPADSIRIPVPAVTEFDTARPRRVSLAKAPAAVGRVPAVPAAPRFGQAPEQRIWER